MTKKILTSNLDIDSLSLLKSESKILIDLLESRVSAGFPSVAENYVDRALDLNELLIKHPAATFFVRVKGYSMINAGIRSGDIVIADRSLTATNGKIVIARIDGELTIKKIRFIDNKIFLFAENSEYHPIEIKEDMDFEVWAVITYVIHQL